MNLTKLAVIMLIRGERQISQRNFLEAGETKSHVTGICTKQIQL
jgi:hypothetical protein